MCLTALLEPTPHHHHFSAFCREWVNKGVFSKKMLAAQLPWWYTPCRAISHRLGLATLLLSRRGQQPQRWRAAPSGSWPLPCSNPKAAAAGGAGDWLPQPVSTVPRA